MFGIAPIRTRGDIAEMVPSGLPPRPSAEPGAESALLRTRSLLDGVKKQQKVVLGNSRLAADVRADELAALALLRSLLEDLECCIAENENPPPTIGKRKALIKVEKARRSVLAAVRECSSHVTESQALFEGIERFIELRPEEPVSPRSFNVRWTRKVAPQPLRPVTRRRDQVYGRNPRPQDSLVMSIVGLSAIAEGHGERDTPTNDTTKLPTSLLTAPGSHASKRAQAAPPPPATTTETAAAASVKGQDTVPLAGPAAGGGGPVAGGDGVGGEHSAMRSGGGAPMSAAQTVHDAALMLQQMKLQQRRTTDSVDAEDDLRPALSHDVAPSGATTLCNMDSCVSGPPARGTAASAAGCEATDSNLRSYGAYEDGDEDEDEVNSAEAHRYDAGSPEHRVALLGGARTAAAAPTRSTASTPPPQPNPVALGMAALPPVPALAMEGLKRSNESLTSLRPVGGVPQLSRRISGTNFPLPSAGSVPFPGNGPAGPMGETILAEGSRADAAAADLDAIDAMTAAAAAPPGGPQPRYGISRHPLPAASALAQPNSEVPAADGAALHPAHAAALAAAAAHPYGANGYPHPRGLTPTQAGAGTAAGAAGASDAQAIPVSLGPHSVPPSVPSSLRDFPAAAPRPNGASGSGALPGSSSTAAAGGRRYGNSQPPSGHHSLDSGQFPASATAWDNVSLADTEPMPGDRRGRRSGRRKGPGGLLGLVRNVVGFVGVSVLSGAAMALGAAAVNTGLDEQQAAQQARQRQNGARRNQQRTGRGGDDLIPSARCSSCAAPTFWPWAVAKDEAGY